MDSFFCAWAICVRAAAMSVDAERAFPRIASSSSAGMAAVKPVASAMPSGARPVSMPRPSRAVALLCPASVSFASMVARFACASRTASLLIVP